MRLPISLLCKLVCLLIVCLPACSSFQQASAGLRQISASGYGAFEADIEVLDENTVAIAWYDTRHTQAEIYLRLLDKQLEPVTAEFRLTANNVDSFEVDIVALGQNIAVTWYEVDSSKHSVVKLGLWNRQGKALWIKTLTTADVNARIPVVEASSDGLFVAWLETPVEDSGPSNVVTITGVWVQPDGLNTSEPFAI